MATLTNYLHVRTIERILGPLVVVEIPQAPGAGVMATLAAHAQRLLMFVFLLVARKTVTRGVFETRRQMTALAGCRNMPSGQWEPGRGMVELFNLPGPVAVTGLAGRARLTLMLIIFFVAAIALN